MTQDGRPSPLIDIRYLRDGPGDDVPDVPDAVVRATVAALTAVGPDRADDIRAAAAIARAEGSDIRFVVREKDHARVRLRIATTSPMHPVPSNRIVLVEDRATGDQRSPVATTPGQGASLSPVLEDRGGCWEGASPPARAADQSP